MNDTNWTPAAVIAATMHADASAREAWKKADLPASTLAQLAAIVGAAHVQSGEAERLEHSQDRMPLGLFVRRSGHLAGTLASAVIAPGTTDELVRLVVLANALKIRLIPFGAGSGVLGATTPMCCEVIVDLKRMDRILALNQTDGTVTAQAGMNGGQFESELAVHGFTCGHFPQSMHISTVGGWAACRGAGQASSRYGKIEDMVVGLKAVLPDGQLLEVRPVARRSVGPSIKDLLIGSEGVFGFITELTLRVWRKPEYEHGVVLAFASCQAGFDALREVVQAELRPQVIRLYDANESAQRTAGLPEFATRPILCILKFSGIRRLAEIETTLAMEICAKHGAVVSADDPYRHWEEVRYQSYSAQWQAQGYYMDTMEVVANWTQLPEMSERMRAAVTAIDPTIHFSVHWSHVYPEGACQYMTIRIAPMAPADALRLHRQVWDTLQHLCLDLGGSIAHHHGAGIFRNTWLARELNAGLPILQAVKDFIDPFNLLNPGKLGLRAAPDAVALRKDDKQATAP